MEGFILNPGYSRLLQIYLLLSAVETDGCLVINMTISQTLSCVVSTIDMTSAMVYSENDEPLTSEFGRILDEYYIRRRTVSNISSMKQVMEREMKKVVRYSNVAEIKSNLNFIIVGDRFCVRNFLDMVQNFDIMYGQDLILMHYSRWILILSNGGNGRELKDLMFDNSLILSFEKRRLTSVETLIVARGRTYLQNLLLAANNLFPNMEYDMKETQLTVTAMEWSPYVIQTNLSDGNLDFVGVSRNVLDGLASTLNFTYRFVMPEAGDKSWGSLKEDGNWTGMVGQLQRKEVDLCITPYAWTIERSYVTEYGYSINYDEYKVTYKKSSQVNKWTFFTTPFQIEIYMYWLLVLATTTGLFLLFELQNRNYRQERYWWRILGVASYVISVPLQQASPRFPASRSSRVLLCFWWLFTIVMTSVYTGNLMASLAVSLDDVPFNTLEELVSIEDYDIGVMKETQIENVLETSKINIFKGLWKKVKKQKQSTGLILNDLDHHTELLSKGGYALICDQKLADVILSKECGLTTMKQVVVPVKSGFVFPMGFPLTDIFSEQARIMLDTGLIDLWEKKWTPKKKICSLTSHSEAKSIDVAMMFGAIIVTFVGIGAALTVLSVELIYVYCDTSFKTLC